MPIVITMPQTTRHDVLMELLALPTAPLNEGHVADYVRGWADRRPAIRFAQDRFGNIVLRLRRGRGTQPPLVLCAHMDHPGFEARRMTGPRRLQADWRGWVHPDYFVGSRVRFHVDGRWVRGTIREVVVGKVRGRQRVKTAGIDVVRPVPPGAIGMWDLPEPVIRGERVYARGCDDIAGVATILAALDELRRGRRPVNVLALLTRAEEIGFGGALAACRAGTIPRRARVVAVETSSQIAGARMGEGPILRVGDWAAVFSPGLTAFCRQVAADLARKDRAFRFQRKLMDGGTCESTAYHAHGHETTGLCMALGRYHNMDTRRKRIAPEYIHVQDYENLVRWFVALATTRRRYDGRQGVDEMLGRLERELLPQLERSAGRVRRTQRAGNRQRSEPRP
ncbi:MAG: M20/M25/M40 family metallo-hydrolase [Planctomycetes bacterium]|nr:M20/M25/M40 family metallo-hydrolase [Planctomycetota bacterium]